MFDLTNLQTAHSSVANQLKDALDEVESLKSSPVCMDAIALDVTTVDAIHSPCSNCALLELKLNSATKELQKFDPSHTCSHCEKNKSTQDTTRRVNRFLGCSHGHGFLLRVL